MPAVINIDSVVRIFLVIIGAVLARLIVGWFSRYLLKRLSTGVPNVRRLKTMSSLVTTSLSLVISIVAFLMILKELGFDITPLLASAGLIGLAISFGSQTIIRDIISGFIILLENQLDEGDEVEISGKKGEVKQINLRMIVLESKDGTLHYIPNGSINLVSNLSKKK